MKLWLRKIILGWLGLSDIDERVRTVEKHFVTKRGSQGEILETLDQVPVAKRKELKGTPKGLSWPQRKAYLEATDGERRAAVGERLPSTS